MAKQIWDNFSGGLSDSDRGAPPSQYYAGRDIDLFRDYGYLTPGFAKSDITMTGLTTGVFDLVYDTGSLSTNTYLYAFSNSRIFCVRTNATNPDDQQETNFNLDARTAYLTISNMSQSKSIIANLAVATDFAGMGGAFANYVLFSYSITGGGGNIGIGLAGTNSWHTSATANYAPGFKTDLSSPALNAGNRDLSEWRGYIWYTNGRYCGRLDPSANPIVTGSFNDTIIDNGANWSSDVFFVTNNYLGVVSHKTNTAINHSKISFFDVAGNLIQTIDLDGTLITSAFNKDGTILLFGDDGSNNTLSTLQDKGIENIKIIQHEVIGLSSSIVPLLKLSCPTQTSISNYRNGLLFGTTGFIFQYGRRTINDNFSLSCPMSTIFKLTQTPPGSISSLKQGVGGKFYVGWQDLNTEDVKLSQFSANYSTNASWKSGWQDMGQRVKINYVKFYFKTLVYGDSLNVGLDLDYTIGTATSLGTITYSKDGAVTSKKFSLSGKQCHAFRPIIAWNSGGTAISKIVIDYQFISD